jgi:hypothetical protein
MKRTREQAMKAEQADRMARNYVCAAETRPHDNCRDSDTCMAHNAGRIARHSNGIPKKWGSYDWPDNGRWPGEGPNDVPVHRGDLIERLTALTDYLDKADIEANETIDQLERAQ